MHVAQLKLVQQIILFKTCFLPSMTSIMQHSLSQRVQQHARPVNQHVQVYMQQSWRHATGFFCVQSCRLPSRHARLQLLCHAASNLAHSSDSAKQPAGASVRKTVRAAKRQLKKMDGLWGRFLPMVTL